MGNINVLKIKFNGKLSIVKMFNIFFFWIMLKLFLILL